MKRLITFLMAAVCILAAKADDSLLVYEGITPAPGSEITSFDFTLKFDLSKITETYGTGYGVGWIGYHHDKRPQKEESVTIYKGNPSDNIVIGRCCDDYYSSEEPGFTASSEVKISIAGAIPEPGVEYTMVITNEFQVFKVGEYAIPLENAELNCFSNPITYTFIGASASSEKLSIAGCSITANQVMDELTEIKFDFSQPVTVNSDVAVEVTEDGAPYAQSTNAELSDDRMSVTYRFDSLPMRLNRSYVISLPGGAVTSAVDAAGTNDAFNIPVVGNYVNLFKLKQSTPADGSTAIFFGISCEFDMPAGFRVYKKEDYALDLSASLYKDEVSEGNLIEKITGKVNNNMNGISWSTSLVLEPGARYILHKPAREFRAYEVATDKFNSDWWNGEVMIVINAPSVEDSGYPAIELGEPVIGQHDQEGGETLKAGDAVEYLGAIEIAPVDYFYKGKDGTSQYRLASDRNRNTGYLYDITSGEPELINEVNLSTQTRETPRFYYTAVRAYLNTTFFEGRRYRFVIPEDEFTIWNPQLYNYVRTPEYSVEFEGATPTEATLLGCTLSEGAELSSLHNVVWTFKGKFELDPEAEALLTGNGVTSKYLLTNDGNSSSDTKIVAHIYSSTTGAPMSLFPNRDWTLTLPEGAVYLAQDPTIRNKEISRSFRSVEAKPEVVEIEPEYVTLTVETEGVHAAAHKAVKGKTAEVRLTPDAYWKVSGLTLNGDDVADALKDGVYTTPELTADATVKAILAYDGNLVFEDTTGVALLPDSDVRIYSEGGMIVVEGVKAGDEIVVYTVSGMLVGRHTATADKVNITVDGGQYVVRVGNEAAKIQH